MVVGACAVGSIDFVTSAAPSAGSRKGGCTDGRVLATGTSMWHHCAHWWREWACVEFCIRQSEVSSGGSGQLAAGDGICDEMIAVCLLGVGAGGRHRSSLVSSQGPVGWPGCGRTAMLCVCPEWEPYHFCYKGMRWSRLDEAVAISRLYGHAGTPSHLVKPWLLRGCVGSWFLTALLTMQPRSRNGVALFGCCCLSAIASQL